LLAKFPDEIERIWSRTGSAEITTDPMGVELAKAFDVAALPDTYSSTRTVRSAGGSAEPEIGGPKVSKLR